MVHSLIKLDYIQLINDELICFNKQPKLVSFTLDSNNLTNQYNPQSLHGSQPY